MGKFERAMWGGSGAIVTIVLGLVHVEPQTMFADFAFVVFLGWLVRTAILFAAGALSVMFYEGVTHRIMLFQLGAAAPTIIAGILSAPVPAPPPVAIPSAIEEKAKQSFMLGVTGTLYADGVAEGQSGIPLRDFTSDRQKYIEPGMFDAFVAGLKNEPADHKYLFYVFVDDGYPDAKTANDVAHHVVKDIRRSTIAKKENLTVEIYAPYKDKLKNYSVVAGARLGEAAARHLLSELLIWDYTEAKVFELNCECYPFGDPNSKGRGIKSAITPPQLGTDGPIIKELTLIRGDVQSANDRLDRLEDLVNRAIAVSAKGRKTAREGDLEIIRRLSVEIGALKRRVDSLEARSRLPD